MSKPLYLPAPMAASGYGLPEVCQRHGRPAVARQRITFQSRPPVWTYILIFLGFLLFVIVALVLRKKIVAAAWPVCDACLATRKRLAIGMGVTGGVVVLAFLSRSPGLIFLTIAAAIVVLAVLGSQRAWANVQAANVTNDGGSLVLRRAYAGYEQTLPGMAQSAAPAQFDWGSITPH